MQVDLLKKLEGLKHCISIHQIIDICIICITKTHFNKNMLDSEIYINGYKFCKKDRHFDIHDVGKDDLEDEISGGGVAMTRAFRAARPATEWLI